MLVCVCVCAHPTDPCVVPLGLQLSDLLLLLQQMLSTHVHFLGQRSKLLKQQKTNTNYIRAYIYVLLLFWGAKMTKQCASVAIMPMCSCLYFSEQWILHTESRFFPASLTVRLPI